MTLINPFVPFTDLEPMEFRREVLGEKGGMLFYNVDEDHVRRYQACGGVVYPEVAVATIAQCEVYSNTADNADEYSGRKSAVSAEHSREADFSTTSSASTAAFNKYASAGNRNGNSKHKNKLIPAEKRNRGTMPSSTANAFGEAYTPALTRGLKALLGYVPALSYFTYATETAARLAHTPGHFFFGLDATSPLYKGFTSSKFAAQSVAFHPYFPIVAIAEQRNPFECAIIRFYDVANSSFIEALTITNPQLRGVTCMKWKPFAKDVLAIGVFGGVVVYSVCGLTAAMEQHVTAKVNGKQMLLGRGGAATNVKRGQRAITGGIHNSYASQNGVPSAASVDYNYHQKKDANSTMSNSHEVSHLYRAEANGNESNISAAITNMNVSAGVPAVLTPASYFLTYRFSSSSASGSPLSSSSSCSQSSSAGGIPVTTIAFSELNGSMMAIGSRGSPDVILHNIACRPRESLLANVAPNYSFGIASNISFLQFSMDDTFLIRGYDSHNKLSITEIATMKTKHFITPAPVLKICRMEAIGFNVFALMLKDCEAVTIAHISLNGGLTILANVVTGVHGTSAGGGVGGAVLDIAVSSFNLYVRVTSGHILVMTVSGSCNTSAATPSNASSSSGADGFLAPTQVDPITGRLVVKGAAGRDDYAVEGESSKSANQQCFTGCEIGVQLKGGIPTPIGNNQIVVMDTFASFAGGALIAVGDGERGTLKFVPSYFTRGAGSV